MQASWIRHIKKRWKHWVIIGLVNFLLFFALAPGQGREWLNDEPWWTYEDDTPILPIDVRLKLFDLTMAYNKAGNYHNEHFIKEYTRREHPNEAFVWRWETFRARWIGFNDYLYKFQSSVLLNAAAVSASGTYINIDHVELAGTTLAVLVQLVDAARDLTYYLEDDIVIEKWEIFIRRLTQLEDVLKDLH